jgi:exodeoxyribonuclease V alpha subunit
MNTTSAGPELELADVDRHFAKFIGGFGGDTELVEATAALLSRSVRQGHICLDLSNPLLRTGSAEKLELPGAEEWRKQLSGSPAFGSPKALTPIVIAGSRIYLRRYWEYEQALAVTVKDRAQRNAAHKKQEATQVTAIDGALKNYFTIVSGGPGTGKTTTVLKILERFLQPEGGDRLRVALAAPTGKAAARLEELLRAIQQDPTVEPTIKERMPRSASTIHRLLGSKPDSVFFRHDHRNPLPLDLLIVDEASMVALPLLAKLFDALPQNARVILIGDRDQLASVEPGNVLADMADAALVNDGPLENSMFVLSKNYRFGNENAIYRLSNAVRAGAAGEALGVLGEKNLNELGSTVLPSADEFATKLEESVVEQYKAYLNKKEPIDALAEFGRFRVLCALREGPFGVRKVNAVIEGILRRHGLIPEPSGIYAGMPILVTRNDYQANLFNGDIGIILPDPTDKDNLQLWAWFIGQDNELRRLSPGRLPDYELAYAMTVHKSQGSEFDRVLLILPDRDSPVVTRELVYTGVTRASKRVDVWFNEEVFRASVGRKAVRASGLRDALTPSATPLSPPLKQGLLL